MDSLQGDTQNPGITAVHTAKGNFAAGVTQGTYVVKELVYAYAMWISPKFHLHVIRAYDAMVQQAWERVNALLREAVEQGRI